MQLMDHFDATPGPTLRVAVSILPRKTLCATERSLALISQARYIFSNFRGLTFSRRDVAVSTDFFPVPGERFQTTAKFVSTKDIAIMPQTDRIRLVVRPRSTAGHMTTIDLRPTYPKEKSLAKYCIPLAARHGNANIQIESRW